MATPRELAVLLPGGFVLLAPEASGSWRGPSSATRRSSRSDATNGRVGFGTKNDGATFDDLTVTAGTLRPRVPSAPTISDVIAGDGTASIRWNPPKDPGNSTITGYRIRQYSGTSTTVQATLTSRGGVYSYTATALTNGSAYSFDVAAINGAGTGAASARSAVVTPTGPTTTTVIAAASVPDLRSNTIATRPHPPRRGRGALRRRLRAQFSRHTT